jgi:hypothetical protein
VRCLFRVVRDTNSKNCMLALLIPTIIDLRHVSHVKGSDGVGQCDPFSWQDVAQKNNNRLCEVRLYTIE